jgi:hypothetical protein
LIFKSAQIILFDNSPSGSSFDGSDGGWSRKHGAYFMLEIILQNVLASGFYGFPSKLWLYFGLIMVRKECSCAHCPTISEAAQSFIFFDL